MKDEPENPFFDLTIDDGAGPNRVKKEYGGAGPSRVNYEPENPYWAFNPTFMKRGVGS